MTQYITRQQVSSRGGGVEISLDHLGYQGGRMVAYQNYLGGGLLGAVQGDCNVRGWKSNKSLSELNEQLKEYFHNLTNPHDAEWEDMSYEQNQKMPASNV